MKRGQRWKNGEYAKPTIEIRSSRLHLRFLAGPAYN
jgi:hypothetical protein